MAAIDENGTELAVKKNRHGICSPHGFGKRPDSVFRTAEVGC